jgi:apolipoprotein N-acyltransferase
MIALSEKALDAHDPDVVVWSETAFVPGVDWHSRYRTDAERYALVQELRAYLEDKEVPFVIGNDDGQLADPLKPPVLADGSMNRVDYNAVLLYEEGELRQTYRKTHLVPFTENFPYKDTFPRFYQLLVDHDYHFWERGTEYTVFETKAGVRFSTPICFEDIFGYLNRRFVQEGADIIVNLTNDSWSGSVAAQMQHMAMAVFRAVELRRSVVRSANSGMTCTIDPDGRVTGILEPFVEDYFYGSVPVYTERSTLYYRWGNWFAGTMLILALLLLSGGAAFRFRSFFRRRND